MKRSVHDSLRVNRMERQRSKHRHHTTVQRIGRAIGWGLLAIGVLVLARIPYFYLRSWWVGTHLAQSALRAKTVNHHKGKAPAPAWPHSVLSVLEIPSLGVTAPVVEGTQEAQLNVAVGHLSTSVLPGAPGTSVLAAHNATWFHHINNLKPGALIKVIDRHHTVVFRVSRSAVVHVGTPVANSPQSTLVLEACYPLNALYFTPYRYLVWAHIVATNSTPETVRIAPNPSYTPERIPAAVKAQGLTLATNYMPMGTLSIQGHPYGAWRQSNAPLNAADATTTLFFAALHIARSDNAAWWKQLAPSIPFSHLAPLVSGRIVRFLSSADETEMVNGSTVKYTTVKITVDLNTPNGVQPYSVSATNDVRNNQVTLVNFKVVPSSQE